MLGDVAKVAIIMFGVLFLINASLLLTLVTATHIQDRKRINQGFVTEEELAIEKAREKLAQKERTMEFFRVLDEVYDESI